jgi:hypothetical protein
LVKSTVDEVCATRRRLDSIELRGAMAHRINWSETFSYGGLSLPTYGEYGGVNYSNGEPNGTPVTTGNRKNPYLTYEQLNSDPDAANPVDFLDYLFYRHDVALMLAGDNPKKQAAADAALLQALVVYEPAADLANPAAADRAEASLYEGATIIAMLYQLANANQLGLISPTVLMAAVTDAINSIAQGIPALQDHLDDLPEGSPFGVADGLFYFGFSTAVLSEATEALVIGTAALSLNEFDLGDPGFPPLFTANDDYVITFNPTNSDVDLATKGWLLNA